jgi:hypothetical protein
MEQEIHITLRYNLAIGNVTLNEIVYRLKELRDALMLRVLKEVYWSSKNGHSVKQHLTMLYFRNP